MSIFYKGLMSKNNRWIWLIPSILTICLLSCESNTRFRLKVSTLCMANTLKPGRSYTFLSSPGYNIGDIVAFQKTSIITGKEYISFNRIIGRPGDVIEFKFGEPYRNGKLIDLPPTSKHNYICISKNQPYTDSLFAKFELTYNQNDTIILNLTSTEFEYLSKYQVNGFSIRNHYFPPGVKDYVIKFNPKWNRDFFGPLKIPFQLSLNDTSNLMMAGGYTPRELLSDTVYFVLGDNVQDCFDSRYVGFVSKKNILGKLVAE